MNDQTKKAIWTLVPWFDQGNPRGTGETGWCWGAFWSKGEAESHIDEATGDGDIVYVAVEWFDDGVNQLGLELDCSDSRPWELLA